MTILCMETSNKTLSVALGDYKETLATYTTQANINHSLTLMPAIDFMMSENKLKPSDLTGLVVAKGPGSYTGLRIGLTTAKTLSWTLNLPLYAVSTLALLASNAPQSEVLIIPLIDARRQSVFTGGYQWQDGQLVNVISDKYIALEDWLQELSSMDRPLCFVSEDVANLAEILASVVEQVHNTLIVKPVNASHLLNFLTDEYKVSNIENFVPTYLKRVEAEEKWLEKQVEGEIDTSHYVTRVE